MARLVMAGFETGDTNASGWDVVGSGGSSALTLVTATPTPRNGTYCARGAATIPSGIASNQHWVNRGSKLFSHASKTELWYAFGLFAHHTWEASTTPALGFFTARDTTNNVNVVLALDSGTIRAHYANSVTTLPRAAVDTTLISAASTTTSMDTWHLIEVHLVASTTTTGTCEVYQDGVQIINVTSTRTAALNANFGSFELTYVYFSANAQATTAAGICYHAFDDVRVNDTTGSVNNGRPADGKVLALSPNGVGTTIGGTPLTGTPSSTNWQNVDETPPSTTDYNAGATVGTGELYALSDPSGGGTAQAINVLAYVLNAANGGGSVGLTEKTAAGTSEGTAQPITGQAFYYGRILDVDPSDAGTWTLSKLTALEAGITVR